ncbi:MAG: peptidoglycan bridge formation glycyltransferase FemA/FemB family protein [Anaerolineae bacterium]|nr:peptidoglycan bridge formation glycyltransferase FemA/FemB family protein [Candidatus Roseilinea sp.]MDW8449387.1 peptidoglycan bridge formation glycyltransferase FemA/FemB family protein [Anaerolineae bacterium]
MWTQVADARAWDAALRTLPSPHLLQSWAWGDFKSRWGWTAERWLLSGADGSPRAAIQLLKRRIRRLPLCVLYAPKGPAAADDDAFSEALALLEQRARAQRAIWVKIDGDPGDPNDGGALDRRRALLAARGWRYSPAQVQFRNTMHTDLRQSDDALLAAMKPKTRYNVRLAEKRGVRVRVIAPISDADARLLYDMYAETGRRDGFIIREAQYYFDAWRALNGIAFVAEHDGRALAGLVLFCFADRAWYFYGMSRSVGREHMPNYLLQWSAMRWARDHGYTVYDWWGAPDTLEDSDALWGVYRFKEGFGARFVEGLGAWDYAPSHFAYAAYLKLAPRVIRSGLA